MQLYVMVNLFNESGKQLKKRKKAIRHFKERNAPPVSNQKKHKNGINSKHKTLHLST